MILYFIMPLLILVFVMVSSFFSNSEMSMVSSNRIKLYNLKKNGNKRAGIILALLNNPERLFGTTLVGNNFANVISTVLADFYFNSVMNTNIKDKLIILGFEIPLDIFISLIMVPLILIFGELFPMSIARKYPNITAMRNAKIIKFAYMIFYPMMLLISNISKFIMYIIKHDKNNNMSINRDELELLVAGRFSNISSQTKKIIEEVFDINELTAEDVMVHLNEVKAISDTATVSELKELINSTDYNRFPVYKDNIFNITSTIHSVNILGLDDKEAILPYTEKLYIIPSTKPIIQILSELKRNRKYMGVVVDEFGASSGIITIDDIVGEIVSDIRTDFENIVITDEKDKSNIFDAKIYLDDFFEETGIDFKDEEAETLGGIINIALGRIGRKGEKVIYKDICFEIIDASDRVVKLVKLLDKSEIINGGEK